MLSKDSVVVIVDGDKQAQELIKTFFSRKDIKVLSFDTPKEAIYHLDPSRFKSKIGLLVTDLYTSDIITGKELSDLLKEHYDSMQALIIVNRPVPLDIPSISRSTGYLFMRQEEMARKFRDLALVA